jgi:hypothetical protein
MNECPLHLEFYLPAQFILLEEKKLKIQVIQWSICYYSECLLFDFFSSHFRQKQNKNWFDFFISTLLLADEVGLSSNAPDLYFKGPWFEFLWDSDYHDIFCGFSQSLQANACIVVSQIKS